MCSGYQAVIRALGLALYGPMAASTRYRLSQYVPGLRLKGIELKVSSLLGDDYLLKRFGGGSLPLASMLEAGIGRLREIRAGDYDVAMLHCELFPLMPGILECQLLRRRPYLYDFDDAFYLKYRHGRLSALDSMLGGKFDTVMRGAAAITAGNATLVDYASRYNSLASFLPTVVDTARYEPKPSSLNQIFTIGWIGSPSTAPYLEQLRPSIERLAAESPVRLVVIGGRAPDLVDVEIVEKPWREDTEVADIQEFDVGVMPLPDDDWAKGKCAFKLIQYMACGIPVVGSHVGANIAVVDPACGFLASSDDEWSTALRALRDDRTLSKSMGAAARARVEQHYSLRRNLPLLASVIHNAENERRA